MLQKLRDANHLRDMEWNDKNRLDLSFKGVELAGEVGEACNIIKKLERERLGLRGKRATVEQLAEELGDVIICVDLIAMHLGIDLEIAVKDKFNSKSIEQNFRTRIE